jgi:hypothetical protein
MSEAGLKADFDAVFFDAWADLAGGIDALYTPPVGAPETVQVLVDTGVAQFGDDFAAVSHYSTFVSFRRGQVEPETGATVVVDGMTYTLAQRVDSSDESISRWAVQQ